MMIVHYSFDIGRPIHRGQKEHGFNESGFASSP